MILILDNYDSFTYNLYQYIGTINPDIKVVRNDKTTIEEIKELKPSHIVISPGPGFPNTAGICIDVIKEFAPKVPILGVCLGHQAIGEAFGGEIVHAPTLMHGKADVIEVDMNCKIFKGLERNMEVGRYHSLVVSRETLPEELKITAESKDGLIMAVKHRNYETYGIQFHPESVLTPQGFKMMENFLGE